MITLVYYHRLTLSHPIIAIVYRYNVYIFIDIYVYELETKIYKVHFWIRIFLQKFLKFLPFHC